MNYYTFLKQIYFNLALYFFFGLLFGNTASSYAVALTNFFLDPASESIEGNITPDDVLIPIRVQKRNFELRLPVYSITQDKAISDLHRF